MPMYNLSKYNSNYSETTSSLWFYCNNKATDFDADIEDTNKLKSFKYKTKLTGSAAAANATLENVTIAVPLKYLSNFRRSSEMPLINSKVELKLTWTKHCVLTASDYNDHDDNSNVIIFTIKDTKLYVLVVIF